MTQVAHVDETPIPRISPPGRFAGREPGWAPERRAPRILWLDRPDPKVAAAAQVLRLNGYEVAHAADRAQAEAVLAEGEVDLIILEVADEAGVAACSDLAERRIAPLLIFSRLSDPLDRVAGLEYGADDYLPKDAHHLELVARVRALRRRLTAEPWTGGPARGADFVHDADAAMVFAPSGRAVRLGRSSNRLLALFVERPNTPMTREEIRSLMYGPTEVTPRAVDVAIARLRRELDACDGAGQALATVRGGGYLLQVDARRGFRSRR